MTLPSHSTLPHSTALPQHNSNFTTLPSRVCVRACVCVCVCVRARESACKLRAPSRKLRVEQELEAGLGDDGPLEAGLGGVIEPIGAQTAGDHGNRVNALTWGSTCVFDCTRTLTCGV